MASEADALTPTQDLVMEVLAARARLGEDHWTFSTRHHPTAKALARLGLVWLKEGIVEQTILVWLTDKGRSLYLSDTYAPPIPDLSAIRAALDAGNEDVAAALGLTVEGPMNSPVFVDDGPCDGRCRNVSCDGAHRAHRMGWARKTRLIGQWREVEPDA